MNRIESRAAGTLPPVTLTPEEAAAVAGALAGHPDGPYADAGSSALHKVVAALEPDPSRRQQLLDAVARHPAGRLRRLPQEPATPPRLLVLPGGRA